MSSITRVEPAVGFLVPAETVAEAAGESAPMELGPLAGKHIIIALRITDIVEQESLHVSIWGSADMQDWGARPLFWFPQKFYRGVTPAALDLRQRPEMKFLKAHWEVNRWGRCDPRPYFKFSVELHGPTP